MQKKTNESIDKIIEERLETDMYERKSDYINNKSKIILLHKKCNREFSIIAYELNRCTSDPCPYCKQKRFNKGQEGFEKQVHDLVGDEYSVIGEYKNYHSKVLMKHNKCGYEYEVRAGNFTSLGRRCPKCSGLLKKDENYVQECLDNIIDKEYTVVGEYKNNVTPIEIKHNFCGKIFQATLKNIQKGRFGCPHCNKSTGELIVSKILEENNIDYIYQFKDKRCKDKKYLPFDFKIDINNETYIIEYDGRQHFMPIFGYNEEERLKEYEKTKRHDEIKNKFCEDNNIHLLRIKYTLTNNEIETSIKDFLNI